MELDLTVFPLLALDVSRFVDCFPRLKRLIPPDPDLYDQQWPEITWKVARLTATNLLSLGPVTSGFDFLAEYSDQSIQFPVLDRLILSQGFADYGTSEHWGKWEGTPSWALKVAETFACVARVCPRLTDLYLLVHEFDWSVEQGWTVLCQSLPPTVTRFVLVLEDLRRVGEGIPTAYAYRQAERKCTPSSLTALVQSLVPASVLTVCVLDDVPFSCFEVPRTSFHWLDIPVEHMHCV